MQLGLVASKAEDQRQLFVVDNGEITCAALHITRHNEIETHGLYTPQEPFAEDVERLKPNVVLLGVSFLKNKGPTPIGELSAQFPDVRS
ncbi:hypothetical protein ACFFWD_31285 [Bradyrhizobium erythrophlei]|uniref:hypothetical protein n=1 Tax=Bradyrhizobium erythrophlei TaxID=1437360 RepID=UPI0035EB0742